VIVEKIFAYLEGGEKTAKEDALRVAMERLTKSLTNQFSSAARTRDPGTLKLYPSEAGKCERQIEYKALGIPGEPMLADVQFKLAMGDLIELALLYVIAHVPGLAVSDNNMIRDIVIGGRAWRGATDGIHRHDDGKRRNLEVKSASGIGFKMTRQKGVDDNFGYLTQASAYCRQLLADRVIDPPGETIFLYIDRDSMKLWETIVPYDAGLADAADQKFIRVINAVGAHKILPRPYTLERGNVLPLNCRYCSHKFTYWTEPRQVVMFENNQPVYREPPTVRLDMIMDKNKPSWVVRGGIQ